jgi:hypothetical protein
MIQCLVTAYPAKWGVWFFRLRRKNHTPHCKALARGSMRLFPCIRGVCNRCPPLRPTRMGSMRGKSPSYSHRRQRNGFMALGGQSQTCFFFFFCGEAAKKEEKRVFLGGLMPPNPRFAKRQAAKVDAYASHSPLNGYSLSPLQHVLNVYSIIDSVRCGGTTPTVYHVTPYPTQIMVHHWKISSSRSQEGEVCLLT